MPLKVALTGATGFVGRAVVLALMAEHHQVSALVRGSPRADLHTDLRQVQGDLQNTVALDDLTKGAEVVIHIAGVIGGRSRSDFFVANEQGTLRVAEAAARNGVKRFVLISSLSAREPTLSAYGASKNAGETVLENFKAKMSVIVLRPPAVYGPGDNGTFPLLRSLTQSIALIPSNSKARFSLIYVDDLARIIVDAAGVTKSGVIELDDNQRLGYDWMELVRIAKASEQRSITPIFLPKFIAMFAAVVVEAFAKAHGKVPIVSRDKIHQLYHWDWVARGTSWPLKEPVGFAAGFKTTIDWYRQAQWLPQRFGK